MDEFNIFDITESDWVGLRLLSLLLSTDVSSSNIEDVTRSMRYFTDKYSHQPVQKAIELITRDRTIKGEWDNPDSNVLRKLYK